MAKTAVSATGSFPEANQGHTFTATSAGNSDFGFTHLEGGSAPGGGGGAGPGEPVVPHLLGELHNVSGPGTGQEQEPEDEEEQEEPGEPEGGYPEDQPDYEGDPVPTDEEMLSRSTEEKRATLDALHANLHANGVHTTTGAENFGQAMNHRQNVRTFGTTYRRPPGGEPNGPDFGTTNAGNDWSSNEQ